MPPKRELSIRLRAELREALDQAAAEQGQTITAIVEAALAAHLGIDKPEQGQTLADRVRDLEQRVRTLEGTAMQRNAPPRKTPPHTAPATGLASTEAAPSGEGGQRRADGVTWLTAKQAWQYCLAQGWVSPRGSTTQTAFVQWAGRNPAELLQQYGLAPTGHSGAGNTTASYRRV